MLHSKPAGNKSPKFFPDVLKHAWVLFPTTTPFQAEHEYHLHQTPAACSHNVQNNLILLSQKSVYFSPLVMETACWVSTPLIPPVKFDFLLGKKWKEKENHTPWLCTLRKANLASLLIVSYKQRCLNQATKKSQRDQKAILGLPHTTSVAAENICTKNFSWPYNSFAHKKFS